MLLNTDGGTPMVPIGEEDLPAPAYMSSAPGGLGHHVAGQKSRVFQGGFYQDLHKMLDVSSGGEVCVLPALDTALTVCATFCPASLMGV
jgi:hypothetical protein